MSAAEVLVSDLRRHRTASFDGLASIRQSPTAGKSCGTEILFFNDESIIELIYSVMQNFARKRAMPIRNRSVMNFGFH